MLTINDYQKEAHKTACYLGLENGDYRYPVMGLAEEQIKNEQNKKETNLNPDYFSGGW